MIPSQDHLSLPNPGELASILGNYLDLVKSHANEISWLLEQHANLRGEYLTFFKKDLKEIESALRGIGGDNPEQNPVYQQLLKDIVENFNRDLERSYSLLNFTFFWKLAKIIESGGSGYEQITSG
jgi:hypothetical protein